MQLARHVISLSAAVILVLAGVPSSADQTPEHTDSFPTNAPSDGLRVGDPGDCPDPDLSDPGEGAITGYFNFYTTDMCDALETMQGIHDASGDTYITFGYRLSERSVDEADRILTSEGEVDPTFDCSEGDLSCVAAARDAAGDAEIRRVLTYSGSERFGSEMLACDDLDTEVVSGGQLFQRVLLPVGETGCEADTYDLVLIANGDPDGYTDVATMLVAADAFDIEMYPGIPRPDQDPDSPWLIDTSYLDTTTQFTERSLQDWESRYGHLDSYRGLYQSSEMLMKGNEAWDAQFDLYDAQHGAIAQHAPGRPILISPYIDGRPDMDSPISAVELFTERLVDSADGAHMILAPQDGRDTGKGGVYFPDQADDIVLERLQDVVGGALTYAEAFGGTTSHDYYEAALEGGKAAGGDSFELWANIELMEPSPLEGEPICIPGVDRGQTDSARVATQISVAGDLVTKFIGYDWDNAMLCEVPGNPTLAEQLAEDEQRPLPTGVTPEPAGTALLTGYHLEDIQGTITWFDSTGTEQSAEFAPATSDFLPDYGASRPGEHPVDLEAVRLRLNLDDLDPATPWISVDLDGPNGTIPYGTYRVEPGPATAECTETVTGEHSGPITLTSGNLCIEDAIMNGPVHIDVEGQVLIRHSTMQGPVTIRDATGVAVEDSDIRGPMRAAETSGPLTLQATDVHGPLVLNRYDSGSLGIHMTDVRVYGSLQCRDETQVAAEGLDIRGPVGGACQLT